MSNFASLLDSRVVLGEPQGAITAAAAGHPTAAVRLGAAVLRTVAVRLGAAVLRTAAAGTDLAGVAGSRLAEVHSNHPAAEEADRSPAEDHPDTAAAGTVLRREVDRRTAAAAEVRP